MGNKKLLFAAAVSAVLCTTVASVSAQGQLPNLTNAAPAARFTITDRVWSTNAGAASICLWEDDKLAAFSLTVDDNSAANIAWWLTQADNYGFKMNWNVITGIVGDSNPTMHGTWAQYANVLARGHDVQSHSVTHDNGDAEYRDSQIAIETNLPGHKCDFIAYPGGSAHPLDPVAAANYYGSARGTTGSINPANKITYMNVYAMSSYTIGNPSAPWADLNNLLNPSDTQRYRGWAVQIHHWVTNYLQQVQPELDFYDAHRADVWMGRYGDVAKYGQERDTAILTTNENSSTRIALTLTDQMLDSRFNYPLTLKVRLPGSWTNVQATQNGQATAVKVVAYNGGNYALVKVVPDQGEIALTPTTAGFTVSPASGFFPLTVTFTDASSGTITNRFWDFGDGATTNVTASSVTHTYTAAGTETVQLIASGPDGVSTNTQVDCISIMTPVAPSANFTATPTNGMAPFTVTFDDISTGSVTNRFWDFGDGTTSNTSASVIAHTYLSTGYKTVQLVVSGPLGTVTNTQTNLINVTALVAPSASFTASPTNGSAPLFVTFTDTSTGTITNRFWDFGDGATTNTTAASVPHVYTSAGTSTVQLIVSGPTGASTNTQIAAVVVTPSVPPTAGFTASPASGTAPLAVTFTDTSTGSITNRYWNFGDGGTTNTTATSVAYTYASSGNWTVQLIVNGPSGSSTNTQAGLISVTVPVSSAGLIVYDPFNDTPTSLTASMSTIPLNWNSDTNLVTALHVFVASNSLSYTGLAVSQGSSMGLGNKTADYYRDFTSPNLTNAGQSVYFSLLIRMNSVMTKGMSGGAFRLFDAADAFGSGVVVGLGMVTNTTGTLAFSLSNRNSIWGDASSIKTPENYTFLGQTYLVVASYTRGSNATNGTTKMWINPDSATFGTATPPTATLSTNTYAMDANWNRLQIICAGSGGFPTNLQVDEVRIGTDWASVVPAASAPVLTPAITSSLTATGTVNQAFSYQITASNSPAVFNAAGLPAGLSVNTNSGAITGTPTFAGSNSITISASNTGGTDNKTLAVVISPVPVDSNGDGIADSWSTLYFGGPTNANASATAANGINTIMETYIAGLNPTNVQSVFTVTNRLTAAQVALQWGSASGRVYSVYWTTNLLNGFQPLVTNIVWPQNSWTDAVHGAQGKNFYQIKVQLAP